MTFSWKIQSKNTKKSPCLVIEVIFDRIAGSPYSPILQKLFLFALFLPFFYSSSSLSIPHPPFILFLFLPFFNSSSVPFFCPLAAFPTLSVHFLWFFACISLIFLPTFLFTLLVCFLCCNTSCIFLYSYLLFTPLPACFSFVTLPALFCIPSCFFIPLPVCFSFVTFPALFYTSSCFFYPSSCFASLLYQHLTPRSYYKITQFSSLFLSFFRSFPIVFLLSLAFLFSFSSCLMSFFLPYYLSPVPPLPLCCFLVSGWSALLSS